MQKFSELITAGVLLLLLSPFVPAAPAPDQGAMLLPLEGKWNVHYSMLPAGAVPGEHLFCKNGRGRAGTGDWRQLMRWERRGHAIVVNYGEDGVIRFVLSEKGNLLEGTAERLDATPSSAPQRVRFTKD